MPPTPNLTLSQTLTLTRGQFFSGAIVWLLPTNPKTNAYLDQKPNLNRGGGGQFSSGSNCPDTMLGLQAMLLKGRSTKEAIIIALKQNLFSLLPLNLIKKGILHFLNAILVYLQGALRKKQLIALS